MSAQRLFTFYYQPISTVMKVRSTVALLNAKVREDGKRQSSYAGSAPNVLPLEQDATKGVSVRYAPNENKLWWVLRVSYGRVFKVREVFDIDGVEYYLPLHHCIRYADGKKKRITEPLLPNLIFLYAEKEYIENLLKFNPIHHYLSYYYNHFITDKYGKNPPLTIDYKCMMNFINITRIDNEFIRLVEPERCHYKSGDIVSIIDGEFKGIEGRVARVAGQQRVVVELSGLCMIATAYIPSAFMKTKEK